MKLLYILYKKWVTQVLTTADRFSVDFPPDIGDNSLRFHKDFDDGNSDDDNSDDDNSDDDNYGDQWQF